MILSYQSDANAIKCPHCKTLLVYCDTDIFELKGTSTYKDFQGNIDTQVYRQSAIRCTRCGNNVLLFKRGKNND